MAKEKQRRDLYRGKWRARETCPEILGGCGKVGRSPRQRPEESSASVSQTERSEGMPAIRRTTFMEFMWKLHRFVYRASDGRVGGAIGGTPVLLLTTTG